ncbi:hypothetical protein ACJX0J_028403 [Zea mays]
MFDQYNIRKILRWKIFTRRFSYFNPCYNFFVDFIAHLITSFSLALCYDSLQSTLLAYFPHRWHEGDGWHEGILTEEHYGRNDGGDQASSTYDDEVIFQSIWLLN